MMKITEIIATLEAYDKAEDKLRYKDYFDTIDNPYGVVIRNKLWKSFPTEEKAKSVAAFYNAKVGRLLAHVVIN